MSEILDNLPWFHKSNENGGFDEIPDDLEVGVIDRWKLRTALQIVYLSFGGE